MNIYFYLNCIHDEEINIMTFYDMASNPFSIGDSIDLSIEELYPIEINRYANSDDQSTLIKNNRELIKLFNRRTIQIVEENKSVEFKANQKPRLDIEYHCVFKPKIKL